MISNMTTAQYLLELIQAKNDMKEALREKGVEVWGGLNTYPDAIERLAPMGAITVYDGTKFSYSTWDSPPLLDTSNVTDMSRMFYFCLDLQSIPQLNTSNVTNMSGAFEECNSISTIPLLDTANVTDMSRMFYGCGNLGSIPKLNTLKVTNMSEMFVGCKYFWGTISPIDTSNVTDMSYMFYGCEDLSRIGQLNVSNVTDMSYMFYGCEELDSVTFVGKVPSGVKTDYMFGECKDFTIYYPNQFANSYKAIIQELPSSGSAIGYDE